MCQKKKLSVAFRGSVVSIYLYLYLYIYICRYMSVIISISRGMLTRDPPLIAYEVLIKSLSLSGLQGHIAVELR